MNNETKRLLEQQFDNAFAASNGIQKLRELILTLAMQGKLVPQDPNDQPASELLKEIELEKQQLVKKGKIKQFKPSLKIKSEEIPYALLQGWEWVRLEDVSTRIHYGYTASANHDLKDVRLLRITDIQDNKVDWKSVPGCEIQEKDVTQYLLANKDILIARTDGTVGKSYLVENISVKAVFASYLIRVIPSEHIDVNYLKLFIECPLYWEQLYAKCSGTGQPNVNGTSLSTLLLPLPPFAEQRRIVAKIDQLMARCDELEKLRSDRAQKLITVHTAALNRLLTAQDSHDFTTAWHFITQHFGELYSVKETVAELRKTILQLAVMGKLVPQDPNDEPASILANTIRSKRSESEEKSKKDSTSKTSNLPINIPFQIPSSWIWQRITDIYEVAGGIQKTPQRTPVSNFFPYLRVANVQRGRLDLSQIEYFELFDGELDKRKLKSSDLLIVEGNGSDKEIGRCAIWNGEIENCVHQNHIIRMRPIGHDGQLFTLLFLNSSCGMAEMKNLAITTSGLYSLSVGKIREILIPLPPLAEQHRIVAKVDQLMALCDRLEDAIAASQTKQTDLLNAVMAQV